MEENGAYRVSAALLRRLSCLTEMKRSNVGERMPRFMRAQRELCPLSPVSVSLYLPPSLSLPVALPRSLILSPLVFFTTSERR